VCVGCHTTRLEGLAPKERKRFGGRNYEKILSRFTTKAGVTRMERSAIRGVLELSRIALRSIVDLGRLRDAAQALA
jgi:hypothetical protein